ncbi:Bifunctional ligase/repressor BirA [Geobacillus sp. BCO2]|nr:Bifunctional ligase/repressor BirA [Geobacillus sp. BCO2]
MRRLGYRIISTPDKVTANEIQLGLKTEKLGHAIHFFDEVDSTQRIAARLAYEGRRKERSSSRKSKRPGAGVWIGNGFPQKGRAFG